VATLSRTNNRFTVQVKDRTQKRRTIRLGKVSERQARVIKAHIEHLALAQLSRIAAPMETTAWVEQIAGGALHEKLTRIGLVKPRKTALLGPYFKQYIAGRTDLSHHTILNLQQTERVTVQHFGTERDMITITRADARDWQRKLLAKYAVATVAMHVKKMRQLYADAVEHGCVVENPFMGVKVGSMVNPERLVYVPEEDIER
jgi:hypothetical protein